jgi:hypothetical protein
MPETRPESADPAAVALLREIAADDDRDGRAQICRTELDVLGVQHDLESLRDVHIRGAGVVDGRCLDVRRSRVRRRANRPPGVPQLGRGLRLQPHNVRSVKHRDRNLPGRDRLRIGDRRDDRCRRPARRRGVFRSRPAEAELHLAIEDRQHVEAADHENGSREDGPRESNPATAPDLGPAMRTNAVHVIRKVIELVCAEVRHG